MPTRTLTVAGHAVEIAETGNGPALVYLHGLADVHGAAPAFLPFHDTLARSFRVIAPAHPCCAGSDEDEDIETIDDLAFRYIETLDALGLSKVALAGACVGGWIAAELAVRHPERVASLVLIGASGLQLPDAPIGDIFWEAQPKNGSDYSGLRRLLFADTQAAAATTLFPDGRDNVERELARYKTMRFASRIGFNPPYFFNRLLRRRLHRYTGPALLLWGEHDRMVPRAHGEAYAAGLGKAKLHIIAGAGHSPHVERPDETAAAIRAFLKPAAPARKAAAPPKRPKAKVKAKAKAKAAARPITRPVTRKAPAKARPRKSGRKAARR
ncbi:MAG TPA: alpha/beta hydrolase [Stellaceae bacterium]|nr:alpha/beta hydrolase [Stellaceae bacterium]